MKTWEVEVDMLVRKTLRFGGPATEEAAREVVRGVLTADGLWPSMAHYESVYGIPRPIERMIDNSPQIVSIKAVE